MTMFVTPTPLITEAMKVEHELNILREHKRILVNALISAERVVESYVTRLDGADGALTLNSVRGVLKEVR